MGVYCSHQSCKMGSFASLHTCPLSFPPPIAWISLPLHRMNSSIFCKGTGEWKSGGAAGLAVLSLLLHSLMQICAATTEELSASTQIPQLPKSNATGAARD